MQKCTKMQEMIEQLAVKHGMDLSQREAHIKLLNGPYMPLVIEKIGAQLVSVAHYYYQNGDACADPDMVFYTGDGGWMPVEITQTLGYTRCLTFNDAGQPAGIDARAYAELLLFAEFWAVNLQQQGWVDHGHLPTGDPPSGPTPAAPPVPPPTSAGGAIPVLTPAQAEAAAAGYEICTAPGCPCGGVWLTPYRAAKYASAGGDVGPDPGDGNNPQYYW